MSILILIVRYILRKVENYVAAGMVNIMGELIIAE